MVREKHRWVFIEVIGDKIDERELTAAIRRKSYELFGTIGGAKIRFKLVEYDPENATGIIRVNLDGLDMLRTVFLFIREINGKEVLINDRLVSGTIKALKTKIKQKKTWKEIWEEKKNLISKLREE